MKKRKAEINKRLECFSVDLYEKRFIFWSFVDNKITTSLDDAELFAKSWLDFEPRVYYSK